MFLYTDVFREYPGADEVVSFIDLQPDNLTKKGILKKHSYGTVKINSRAKKSANKPRCIELDRSAACTTNVQSNVH